MGTKTFKLLVFAVLIVFISGCDPAKQFCDDMATFARVPDLLTLEPHQNTYYIGDVITLKGSIANKSPLVTSCSSISFPKVSELSQIGPTTSYVV